MLSILFLIGYYSKNLKELGIEDILWNYLRFSLDFIIGLYYIAIECDEFILFLGDFYNLMSLLNYKDYLL